MKIPPTLKRIGTALPSAADPKSFARIDKGAARKLRSLPTDRT